MNEFNPKMFDDIRELCICSAKAVTVISERYNENPKLISKLFIEAYTRINDKLEEDK